MLKIKNNNLLTKYNVRKHAFGVRKKLSSTNYYSSFYASKNLINYIQQFSKKVIGCYWPINNELDIRPFIKFLYKKKTSIALPYVKDGKMLFKSWKAEEKLKFSIYKFYSPESQAENIKPDIIITPALAVDNNGNRVGYGKGFYDKYYAKNKSKIFIGYTHNQLSFKALPFDEHDLKLDALVTDTFVKTFNVRLK